MQNSYSKDEVTFAGFWVRLAAYIIDSAILLIPLLIVRLLISGVLSVLKGTPFDGNVLFNYTIKDILLYIFQILYFVLFVSSTGTTPGKKLMNLRVISAETGEMPGFFDVLYRETIGRFLCGLFLCIGYIAVGIDKEKRGFHDMLSDTRVIYAKKVKIYPSYQSMPGNGQNVYSEPAGVPPVPQMVPEPGNVQPQPENEQVQAGGQFQSSVQPQGSVLLQNPVQPQAGGQFQGSAQPQGNVHGQGNMPRRDFSGSYHMVQPGERMRMSETMPHSVDLADSEDVPDRVSGENITENVTEERDS